MSNQVSTKNRILDAAEELFAEHGFSETSLRVITANAEVNLASVNYHFGSKKSLIEAVFDRYMECFTNELMSEMVKVDRQDQKITVSKVLNTLVRPLLEIDNVRPNGSSVFMKLLGRAYAETQGHIRRFAMERYSHVLARFTRLLHKASPELKPSEMFWRLHFMLGAFIFTLAGHEALQEISESDFGEVVDVKEIIARLIPFLSAGFSNTDIPANYLSAGEA
ncbi:TetR/AcrR family transcriptional regulator [Aliikangiella coralliicola]|uniref:TetR/AcrR family transcriptional regulator n=1 Tax=Aliikangiella coralliicola TaxID=2592383 RepID=A0A545U0C1_9GAMM|nr:TetR/AcrR family transcriptional regulator [Aliikangiella coralliicola]TQV82912.1 TetR/AcrR family transcriptional regulator [Aliikangiella coralliicola]